MAAVEVVVGVVVIIVVVVVIIIIIIIIIISPYQIWVICKLFVPKNEKICRIKF
jgi:hypothetical protein